MALFFEINASVESNLLTIHPPVPVLVLNSSLIKGTLGYFPDPNFEPPILTCKSTGNNNITWDVPDFNFAELSNQKVIYVLRVLFFNF